MAVLTGTGHDNRTYELTDANGFTLPEYAAELSHLTGKEVVYTEVTAEALTRALVAQGLPLAFATLFASCDVGISRGELADSSGDLARLIGRPVTSWRETLADAVRARGPATPASPAGSRRPEHA